jgi:hypothetical protein
MKINNEVRKIRIVIIDSGISRNESYLKNSIKKEIGFEFNTNRDVIELHNPKIKHEHGTVIAKTIKSMCSDVEFISINILDENLSANGRVLIEALKQSLTYKPQIVHLSLGTTKLKYWYSLKKLTRILNKNNIIVVSAANNEGKRSYPAYFKDVVGVKGTNINNDGFYYDDEFFYSSLYLPEVLCKDNEKYKRICGNSISAAYITGHISKIILDLNLKSNKEIVDYLKYEGLKNHCVRYISNK